MKILKQNINKKVNFVATPIGNLDDITLRAVKTLQESDIIYAEDTKVSQKLCKYLKLKANLKSLHKYNEVEKSDEIINYVNEGKVVSIISDAGTPLINDPGTFLAKKLVENEIMLYPVIGASCLSATLSINSFNSDLITYIGFIDKRSKDKIKYVLNGTMDVICLVSPHYISALMKTLNEDFCRDVIIAKELTKLHETHMYLTTQEYLDNETNLNLKGEFTLIIKKKEQKQSKQELKSEIEKLINQDYTNKDILKYLKQNYTVNKNEVYEIILKIRRNYEK